MYLYVIYIKAPKTPDQVPNILSAEFTEGLVTDPEVYYYTRESFRENVQISSSEYTFFFFLRKSWKPKSVVILDTGHHLKSHPTDFKS
jgi:hypothetical protein